MRRLSLPLAYALLLAPSLAATPPPLKVDKRAEKAGARMLALDARRQIVTEGSILHVESLTEPGVFQDVPIEELRLVNPYARQTALGVRIGALARTYGRQQPSNRKFFSRPRIACAAYVSYVLRKAGWKYGSNSATALYGLARKHGGRLIATRVGTRYTKFFPLFSAGDLVFFHKGSRMGHVEIYVGGGLVSGTSSSIGRVGIRKVSSRGYSLMTVVRL